MNIATTTSIAARMDRLPMSGFHYRLLSLIGAGLFFDGIDLFLPGSLLPFLVRDHLAKASDVALLPSLTAVGLLLGAVLAAYLGDRRGRKALYQFNLVVYAGGTLLCACAPTFHWLLIFRFISAIGLGGESVVGYGMFPEFLPPQKRGVWCTFLALITTLSFPVAAGLAAVVLPTLGWRWMFVIAGVPVVFTWWWRRQLPESPRWLARIGKTQQAEQTLAKIEREVARGSKSPLPEPTPGRVSEERSASRVPMTGLFRSRAALRRTLVAAGIWTIAVCATAGYTTFLPTVLVAQGHSASTALRLGFLISLGAIPGFFMSMLLVDRWGRKPTFLVAATLTAVLGVIAAFTRTDAAVIAVGLLLYTCMDTSAVLSNVYVPETFPTEARLTGTGFAFACGRTSFIFLPLLIALLLRTQGPAALYFLVAALGLALALLVAFGAFETRGRSLEEIESSIQGTLDEPVGSTGAQG